MQLPTSFSRTHCSDAPPSSQTENKPDLSQQPICSPHGHLTAHTPPATPQPWGQLCCDILGDEGRNNLLFGGLSVLQTRRLTASGICRAISGDLAPFLLKNHLPSHLFLRHRHPQLLSHCQPAAELHRQPSPPVQLLP